MNARGKEGPLGPRGIAEDNTLWGAPGRVTPAIDSPRGWDGRVRGPNTARGKEGCNPMGQRKRSIGGCLLAMRSRPSQEGHMTTHTQVKFIRNFVAFFDKYSLKQL